MKCNFSVFSRLIRMSGKICIGITFLCAEFASGQADVPVPSPPQKQPVYLTNATIHVGDGRVLQRATIGFDKGKIIFLEENPTFKTDETIGRVIDCSGKHIYPGLIAPNTIIGLSEIEAVRATNDYRETGQYNPNARSIISYNTDSRVTPTIRSNGVLYAQVVPQGGVISGTSSVVQLDAWNWEDALVKEDGIWLNWPSELSGGGWWAEPAALHANKEYHKQVEAIKSYFKEAKSYCAAAEHTKTNLRFEAMCDLFNKRKNLYVNATRVNEMQHAILLGEEMGMRIVLCGADESWKIAGELARKGIPVILGETHDLPGMPDDDIDIAYKTPYLLQQAGVLFCISIPGAFWQQRNLMFQAGTAAAYGLSKEDALRAITLNAAKILGIDNHTGSLEKGKAATLIVSTGDLLDMRTSHIELAFIDGREIDLNNKQKELYEKFKRKYGLQ
ncbi:MAG: amidohydrolase family protein [Chitinophagales bacterium]|nr:amidohydrolase family protein [Chitinophagales bacterium]MDW8418873.1 amidohydrolase family protein [Chitinophagales bacterium]